MITIKGPIKLRAGEPLPKNVMDAIPAIKLPFTVKNLTFSNPKLDGKKFKMADGEILVANKGKLEKIKI